MPHFSCLRNLLVSFVLLSYVTVAAATASTSRFPLFRHTALRSRSDPSTLCGNGKPPKDAGVRGNASVPLFGPGADPDEFIEWSVVVADTNGDANSQNQTTQIFYFTIPQDILDTSASPANLSCLFDASPGAASLDRSRNGSTSCEALVGHECSSALSQTSQALVNATFGQIANAPTIVCEVDVQTQTTVAVANCAPVTQVQPASAASTAANGDGNGNGYDWRSLVLAPVLGGVGLVAVILGVVLYVRRRRQMARVKELQDSTDLDGLESGGPPRPDGSSSINFKPVIYAESGYASSQLPDGSEMSELQDMRPFSEPSSVRNFSRLESPRTSRGETRYRGGDE